MVGVDQNRHLRNKLEMLSETTTGAFLPKTSLQSPSVLANGPPLEVLDRTQKVVKA